MITILKTPWSNKYAQSFCFSHGTITVTLILYIADILVGEKTQQGSIENSQETKTVENKDNYAEKNEQEASTQAEHKHIEEDIEEDAVAEYVKPPADQEEDENPVFQEEVQTTETEINNDKDINQGHLNEEPETNISSRDRMSRRSFKCRGCGIESNKAKFEDSANEYAFERDDNQRSMSDTFTRRKKPKAATIDSAQVCIVLKSFY